MFVSLLPTKKVDCKTYLGRIRHMSVAYSRRQSTNGIVCGKVPLYLYSSLTALYRIKEEDNKSGCLGDQKSYTWKFSDIRDKVAIKS